MNETLALAERVGRAASSAPQAEASLAASAALRGEVCVRRAPASDIPAIEDLHRASARALAAAYYSPAQLDGFLAGGTLDRGMVDAGTYYVAEIDGALVGSAGWSADETAPSRSRRARIRGVFVHPDLARHGIGRRLVTYVEAEAARAGFAVAELTASLAGVPLYRRLGYDEVASVGLELPGGAALAVIRMRKVLAP